MLVCALGLETLIRLFLAPGNVTSLLRCHSQGQSHHMDHHIRQLARPGFSHREHFPSWLALFSVGTDAPEL